MTTVIRKFGCKSNTPKKKICNLANKYTKSILVWSAHKIVVFVNLIAKVNEIQLVEFNFVNKTPRQ